jgi:hypothetical protein
LVLILFSGGVLSKNKEMIGDLKGKLAFLALFHEKLRFLWINTFP